MERTQCQSRRSGGREVGELQPTEGIWAYINIHLWFTRTRDQGRSMSRAATMDPTKCQREHEMSAAVERWEERYRTIKEDAREIVLPDG